MPRRRYRMGRRAESAEETRQRIVRATFDLHAERGIVATRHRDIAERAGVAIGTVYHHFPGTPDVVKACGAFTAEYYPPPGLEVLGNETEPGARLQHVVAAWCAYYARFPGQARIRLERDKVPAVDAWFEHQAALMHGLLARAIRPRRAPARALKVAAALLDIAVYQSLVDAGVAHAAAVDEITQLARQRLLGPESDGTRQIP